MSLKSALIHSKSGMVAESARISAVSSNIANANSESSNKGGAYKAQKVLFSQVLDNVSGLKVLKVVGTVESGSPSSVKFSPGHPMSDENGYVYGSNVNTVEEMTDLMSASRAYENNTLVVTSVKRLMDQTLRMGK
jgi:flagellar basal-body rod protein FlgC